ncbi:hypothetical protein EJ04DRAFT_9650 [Polyplosphaeria fusca]|uniref:Uncharacterized protein n=1 Tax=Polyplosphaeria fusca TaxID=682080 RepID=A0A9P4R4C2_9PLEO|nr:hypothetical protein EJ04DRAFT_9650 [Polyplosphaeria fusca]
MASPGTNPTVEAKDPFANQRENTDTLDQDGLGDIAGNDDMRLSQSPPSDRRMSKEWDASKVPPSQFQRRKGSIYSTPNSRDGHVKDSSRDQAYWDKLKEKGWVPGKKN